VFVERPPAKLNDAQVDLPRASEEWCRDRA